MKLIAKYNRVTLPIIVGILLISSIGYYFILHRILIYQLDKDLRIEQREIIQHVTETGQLPETSDYKDQEIFFQPTDLRQFETRFYTQDVYNKRADETESFRRIDFLIRLGGQRYIATVKKSQQETEDIVRLILSVTFVIILILLLILLVSNRFFLRKLWSPFRDTLQQLNQFSFSAKNKIQLQPSDIDEFRELNETVEFMTQKVTKDYQSLKGFTENASHEIQTPLAIIKNRTELLSQSEHLDENDMHVLQSINEAAARLSRLNQSLLLLAKIENLQFTGVADVSLSLLLQGYLDNYDELVRARKLSVTATIPEGITVQMNESLAEILVSNLLSNAIRHNVDGGSINVALSAGRLVVSNTGPELRTEARDLFTRFRKDSFAADSLGLGLSIVKTITDLYGFTIHYTCKDRLHILEMEFAPSSGAGTGMVR